jgi:hypothetical protein
MIRSFPAQNLDAGQSKVFLSEDTTLGPPCREPHSSFISRKGATDPLIGIVVVFFFFRCLFQPS